MFSVFKASKGPNPTQVGVGSRGGVYKNKTNTGSICWELGEELKCVLRTQQDEKSFLVGVIREAFVEELALVLNLRPKRKQALLNSSLDSQVKRWAHLRPDIPIFQNKLKIWILMLNLSLF